MLYNKILEKILLPLGDLLMGTRFIKDLNFWRSVDQLNEKELDVLQSKNLKKIIIYAVSNTKYYQHITLKGENPFSWIQQFPILTKEQLNNKQQLLLTESKKGLTKISSSGSSGVTSSVYMNNKDISSLRAGMIHWWEWSGYKLGMPLVQTGITPNRSILKSIKDFFFKTIYINAFAHSQEQLKNLCDQLNGTKKYYLSGYASSLNVIAEFAIKNKYSIQLKSVISLGDKLFSHYRENITKAFHCNVFDTYGSAEGFLVAAQSDLEYLYILSPQTYIEILDDNNNPVPDGEMGYIVATRLDGFAMPLIRYKIGDLGIMLPKNKYPKNRKYNFPLLQQIVGRETDVVKTKSGKTLVVHSFTGVFEYISEIKQFKIIQKTLEGIIIEYIPSKSFSLETLKKITFELQKYLKDESFKIEYKEVENILTTASGKPQIIESYL